jgi:DNA-binding MarR family transcriptional regulator
MNAFDTISAPIEHSIATGLARIATVMRSQAWARAFAEGITPTQSDILTLLGTRQDALRLSVIAQQLAISAATASEAVSTLVDKGLVEKGRAADDRRAVALSLSSKGKALAASAGEHSGLLAMGLQVLTPAEKSVLLGLIVKIIKGMQERGEISPSRMCVNCDYYQGATHADPALRHYCNLVGAPFEDRHLRLDCQEHRPQSRKVVPIRELK